MSDFKKLQVWEKAHALAIHAYRVATRMRRSSDLPLRSQIIRAATSIPANIVEGRRQESDREFARFLRIALNSAYELEYHLILARDIEAISQSDSQSLVRECIQVRRMIFGLLKKLGGPSKARTKKGPQSSERISRKAFSPVLLDSRTERTSIARPFEGVTTNPAHRGNDNA